jgi:hypothetical protein
MMLAETGNPWDTRSSAVLDHNSSAPAHGSMFGVVTKMNLRETVISCSDVLAFVASSHPPTFEVINETLAVS